MQIFILYFTVSLLSITALPVLCKSLTVSSHCRLLQKDMRDSYDVLRPKGCLLKHYKTSDVVQCIDRLSTREDLNNKNEWHIAFMGDSRIRQMYHSFARLLPTEDLEVTGHFNPRDVFAHQDALITSELLSLRVTFKWHPFPDNLRTEYQTWLGNHNKAPDLLITSQTLWTMIFREHSLENFTKAFEEITPLMKNLTEYSEIIWWDQDPLNEKPYHLRAGNYVKADVNNARIKVYGGLVRQLLTNTGIIFWDSTDDLLSEYVRSCDVLPTRKDTWRHWKCDDFVHASFLYADIYNQQLLNYLCNPRLKFGPKYCCND